MDVNALPIVAPTGTIAAHPLRHRESTDMSRKRSVDRSGTMVVVEFDSKILAGNPLGDPHRRKLAVWLPPGYDSGTVRGRSAGRGRRFPVLFDLVGFTGSGLAHLNWRPFDENVPERAARLVAVG